MNSINDDGESMELNDDEQFAARLQAQELSQRFYCVDPDGMSSHGKAICLFVLVLEALNPLSLLIYSSQVNPSSFLRTRHRRSKSKKHRKTSPMR